MSGMGLSVDGLSSYYLNNMGSVTGSDKAEKLQQTLFNTDVSMAEDEELLEACKSFETYFVEQVFKEMKKTVHSSDDEGEYMQYFGDMLVEQYAEAATESGGLGIARLLYDSMKRNMGDTTAK